MARGTDAPPLHLGVSEASPDNCIQRLLNELSGFRCTTWSKTKFGDNELRAGPMRYTARVLSRTLQRMSVHDHPGVGRTGR